MSEQCVQGSFFFPSQGHRNEASIFNVTILSTQCMYLPSKRLAALTQMNWRHDRFSWSAEKATANFTMSPTFLKVTITKLNNVVPSNYNVYPWLFNSTAMPLSRLRCDINMANYTNRPNNMEVQSWWLNNKCNAFVRRYRLLGWAWASPTLVRRHCKHACVYMSVCLRPYTVNFKLTHYQALNVKPPRVLSWWRLQPECSIGDLKWRRWSWSTHGNLHVVGTATDLQQQAQCNIWTVVGVASWKQHSYTPETQLMIWVWSLVSIRMCS